MYSTESYSQYPMINEMEKNGKEEYMCVYNWVSLVYCRDWHYTALINQLYFHKKEEMWILPYLLKNSNN